MGPNFGEVKHKVEYFLNFFSVGKKIDIHFPLEENYLGPAISIYVLKKQKTCPQAKTFSHFGKSEAKQSILPTTL
jgi:hypothetical protein